jgi:hypothetical protein
MKSNTMAELCENVVISRVDLSTAVTGKIRRDMQLFVLLL